VLGRKEAGSEKGRRRCPFQGLPIDYSKPRSSHLEKLVKYLCLVMIDEKRLEALSGSEAQELDDLSIDHALQLRQGGHLLVAHALQSTHSATTIRLRGGQVSVTDGPFAETKEQVGGFLLIEARDLNEAIQLASTMPAIHLGGIEIRPLKELVSSIQPEKKV
jgi:hypothetical protein